MSNNILFQM